MVKAVNSPVDPRNVMPSAPWLLYHSTCSFIAPKSTFKFLSQGVVAAAQSFIFEEGAFAAGAAMAASIVPAAPAIAAALIIFKVSLRVVSICSSKSVELLFPKPHGLSARSADGVQR